MAKQLPVEPCTLISVSKSVAEAQVMLEEDKLAVIHEGGRPLALVQSGDLAQTSEASDRPMAELLSRLASPILVDTSEMSSDTILDLLMLMEDRNIPGLIVYRDEQIEGVIPQKALDDALPLSDNPFNDTRGGGGLYGDPVTPAWAYICRKCEQDDPPPPILLPSQGDSAPTCPKHWLHGPMTPLGSEDE
jgi:hypothetical protein